MGSGGPAHGTDGNKAGRCEGGGRAGRRTIVERQTGTVTKADTYTRTGARTRARTGAPSQGLRLEVPLRSRIDESDDGGHGDGGGLARRTGAGTGANTKAGTRAIIEAHTRARTKVFTSPQPRGIRFGVSLRICVDDSEGGGGHGGGDDRSFTVRASWALMSGLFRNAPDIDRVSAGRRASHRPNDESHRRGDAARVD